MNQKEELLIYRRFFHKMSLYALVMNNEKVTEGVSLISQWSYAHRSGNGEPTEYEQKQQVNYVIEKMEEFTN